MPNVVSSTTTTAAGAAAAAATTTTTTTTAAAAAAAAFAVAVCAVVFAKFRTQLREAEDAKAGAVSLKFCQRLPKVELHAHINGSIRASTLEELVFRSTQRTTEGDDEAEDQRRRRMLETLKLRAHDQRSLKECFAIFDVIHSVVSCTSTVTRIARECVEDFAADGCVYLELRSTPRRDIMSAREYVAAVELGLAQGESRAGGKVVARLILSINRGQSVEAAEDTVDLALELVARPSNRYIVGVELSGNPFASDFKEFEPALARARAGGLLVAVHAAEVDNEDETQRMLDFRPERLGHALCLSPAQVEEVVAGGMHVEICPTSNRLTLQLDELAEHPTLATWLSKKHSFSINTDDCGVFETSLSREYYDVGREFRLSREALKKVAIDSIRASFAPTALAAKIEQEILAFKTE